MVAMADLVLYTRQGCCLCEGLAEKLLLLQPAPHLRLIDVDAEPQLQRRFGLEVPVLAQVLPAGERLLPRVPPRLAGEQLRRWLVQQGVIA
jgi:hypothetical protein